jgi:hypothetical protein
MDLIDNINTKHQQNSFFQLSSLSMNLFQLMALLYQREELAGSDWGKIKNRIILSSKKTLKNVERK